MNLWLIGSGPMAQDYATVLQSLKVDFKDVVDEVMLTALFNCIIPSNFVTPGHSVAEASSAIKVSDESNK